MEIQRKIRQKLVVWKNSPTRKPLVLQGARQVGKTWLLKKFGEENFESVAYFNFDKQLELKQFFETTKDPKRILQNLSLIHGKTILPEKTLVVFDEIQECNDALNALKIFLRGSARILHCLCRFTPWSCPEPRSFFSCWQSGFHASLSRLFH